MLFWLMAVCISSIASHLYSYVNQQIKQRHNLYLYEHLSLLKKLEAKSSLKRLIDTLHDSATSLSWWLFFKQAVRHSRVSQPLFSGLDKQGYSMSPLNNLTQIHILKNQKVIYFDWPVSYIDPVVFRDRPLIIWGGGHLTPYIYFFMAISIYIFFFTRPMVTYIFLLKYFMLFLLSLLLVHMSTIKY